MVPAPKQCGNELAQKVGALALSYTESQPESQCARGRVVGENASCGEPCAAVESESELRMARRSNSEGCKQWKEPACERHLERL